MQKQCDAEEKELARVTERAEGFTANKAPQMETPVQVGKSEDYIKSKLNHLKERKAKGLKEFPEGMRDADELLEKAQEFHERGVRIKKKALGLWIQ